MAFGENWFAWITPTLAIVIHLIIFLIALWYMVKAKKNNNLMWAFLLLALGQLFYAFVFLKWMDQKTTLVLNTVFILIAIVLVGKSSMK